MVSVVKDFDDPLAESIAVVQIPRRSAGRASSSFRKLTVRKKDGKCQLNMPLKLVEELGWTDGTDVYFSIRKVGKPTQEGLYRCFLAVDTVHFPTLLDPYKKLPHKVYRRNEFLKTKAAQLHTKVERAKAPKIKAEKPKPKTQKGSPQYSPDGDS